MWNLKNCTALVTGGTKGIGRATVLEFLNLGAKVLFTARNEENIKTFETELKFKGFDVTGIPGDISIPKDRKKIIHWIKENWNALDILVNNAGVNIRKKALNYTEDEFDKVLNINLIAPFELSRELHFF